MSEVSTEIKVGDAVEWTSGASGSTSTKRGTVLAIIPREAIPSEVYPQLKSIPLGRIKLGNGIRGGSEKTRALVEVCRFNKDGKALTPWYYGPRLASISKVS
jgi:hypothetical protein